LNPLSHWAAELVVCSQGGGIIEDFDMSKNQPKHLSAQSTLQHFSPRNLDGRRRRSLALRLLSLSSVIVLSSCGSAPSPTSGSQSAPAAPQAASESLLSQDNLPDGAASQAQTKKATPAPRPQLIKSAAMTLTVKSAEDSMKLVSDVVKQQQGDLLGFQDRRPTDGSTPYSVNMQIRVPQNNLEPTLIALGKLGTVDSQSLQAEDVSNQLVDFQARLKNLKASETVLQGIMQRSGTVADVLKVSQELSEVRQSIEQIDAQLTNLKNQVAYSTVQLTLREAVANTPPQKSLATELQNTWNRSTRSLAGFSVGLLKFIIWLLVYSPYWLLIGLGIYFFLKWRRSSRVAQRQPNQPPTSPSEVP
jgi:hypothetical protein